MNDLQLAIILFLGWLIIAIGKITCRQAKELNPKIKLSFDKKKYGIAQTPIAISPTQQSNASYLRINISTISNVTVKNCDVILTCIERKDNGKFESLPFPQPLKIVVDLSIKPLVNEPVDFLQVVQSSTMLQPTIIGGLPLVLANELNKIGTYRFTIVVNAAGISSCIKVIVIWDGQWDRIDAYDQTKAPN